MNDETVAYQRPTPPTLRERAEYYIEKLGDAYQALWDVMPAVAAVAFLLFLLNHVPVQP